MRAGDSARAAGTALAGHGLLFGTARLPAVAALAPRRAPRGAARLRDRRAHAFLGAIVPTARAAYVLFQRLDILTSAAARGRGDAPDRCCSRAAHAAGSARAPVRSRPFLLTGVEDVCWARAARLYPAQSSISAALPVLTGAKFAVMALMAVVIAGCALRLAWRKD